ncbi:MAG: hypothetical protein KAW19_08250 [Candidatus Aminicenantes bacterium]|nr:hypothetical protein [Candidatus Aminicenantes bacterium]
MKDENKPEVKTEKKKLCPFNPDLECENCRLYQSFMFGGKETACVFLRMND